MMQLEKDCEMKGHWVMGVLCPGVVKNTEKNRKLKEFHFLNICEEGKSPRMLPNWNFTVSITIVSIIL